MARLIVVLLILFSCSNKTDLTNLKASYKQIVVGNEFLIITTEKEWFNNNLFLLDKNRAIVQKSNLPFENQVIVRFEEDKNLNLYYFVKDRNERAIIEKTIDVSPVYLNDQINVNLFFIEDYKGWRERNVLSYEDFNLGTAEISLSNENVVLKIPLSEIIRQNSKFYRVIFEEGYLNYFPIQNYENFHNDLQALIRGETNN
ncbi:hypothetical protein SYJ56_05010 [Algoriphagus sp. D3-2-R+10]|uniref:hypothetical protein n=1 Tax=Algoriphagus aurantiacus TaxID=3103948 RepID=UPI002B3BC3A7|nr:hypothetical protein [Algoriphagus sp. D3-2-R+10]MEB2774654.1 hypothetical protein [Algoriphagus sp. D3-2-R+10]